MPTKQKRTIVGRNWSPADDEEVIRLYNKGLSYLEMARKFGVTEKAIDSKIQKLKRLNRLKPIRHLAIPSGKGENVSLLENLVLTELKKKPQTLLELSEIADRSIVTIQETIKSLHQRGFDVEYDKTLDQAVLFRHPKEEFKPLDVSHLFESRLKFGVNSDPHYGSKYQQPTLVQTAYKIMEDEKVKFALNTGDITDGVYMYAGHEQERFLHSADEMRDYVIEHYPKTKAFPTYLIGGSHDWSFVKKVGYNVLRAICDKRTDLIYRGAEAATFNLEQGVKVRMIHPSGGVPYARSYRTQKLNEGLGRGKSIPKFLFVGHLHVMDFLSYLGIYTALVPCMQAQTPYLERKGLNPELGFWIFTVEFDDKKNITSVVPKYYDFNTYVKERDY